MPYPITATTTRKVGKDVEIVARFGSLSWAPPHTLDSMCLDQLKNVSTLPWVYGVRLMPDGHGGYGVPIGSVIATKKAIMPMAVGVDIGCGMGAIRLNMKADALPENLKDLRHAIEDAIPTGASEHEKGYKYSLPFALETARTKLFDRLKDLDQRADPFFGKAMKQIGTLGGGNHFIELCLDTKDRVWVMLHSGSRRIGKELAEIHTGEALKLTHNEKLPDKHLAALLAGTPQFEAYRRDLYWAQEYAMLNRKIMMALYRAVLAKHFSEEQLAPQEEVWCHHNYVAEEVYDNENVFVTRKGAIRAGQGEMGIIPGSMGTHSFIVKGLGSAEAFNSASHGAGRRMSRGAARKLFREGKVDIEEQLKGIECLKDSSIADELPSCYKDVHEVMANQTDLVAVHEELHQVMCVKGGNDDKK